MWLECGKRKDMPMFQNIPDVHQSSMVKVGSYLAPRMGSLFSIDDIMHYDNSRMIHWEWMDPSAEE